MENQQEINYDPERKYKRNYTPENRQKQLDHLANIRQLAHEKKREIGKQTLKAKLMKYAPTEEMAKKYDEFINSKVEEAAEIKAEEKIKEKIKKEKPKKKIIYQESSESESEEEVIIVKKKPPKQQIVQQPIQPQQPSLDSLVYKSASEQLHMRAVEERIRSKLNIYSSALAPREY